MANPETCVVCGTHNDNRSMAYRGDPWCSDNCHKRLAGQLDLPQHELTAIRYWEAFSKKRGRGKGPNQSAIKKELYQIVRNSHEEAALRVYGVEGQAVSSGTARPADRR